MSIYDLLTVFVPCINCSTPTTGTKRKGGAGGLNKVCGVSPELQVVVGEPALPRTEVVTPISTKSL